MEKTDILIIGAGVVGLAVCSELSQKMPDKSIIILEKHQNFGQETSSRNSEVIHSGIYYPKNSLKALMCVEGRELLYEFCDKNAIRYSRTGKFIIANGQKELNHIYELYQNGVSNGVRDLQLVDKNHINTIEPFIYADGALFSPCTGVIDSHSLMARLEKLSENNGAVIGYGSEVISIEKTTDGYVVKYKDLKDNTESIKAKTVINSAGLFSDKIAQMAGFNIDKLKYRIYLCKGEYFSVSEKKSKLVNHLIYPPPELNLKSIGLHITKGIEGRLRVGPSAFYVKDLDYSVDSSHLEFFYETVKAYFPVLEKDDLAPEMSGIRPKLQNENDPFRDFIIVNEKDNGFENFINLIGIESPGLTSCLAIAKKVAAII